LVLCTLGSARAQSIFTIAGGGSDDGRPATLVSLSSPSDLALDAAGNLIIADTYSNRIRKVSAKSGVISTVAGYGGGGFSGDGGPATKAALSGPVGIAIDAAGNLYIVVGERIRKVSAASGIITTVAGNGIPYELSGDGGPATAAGLESPRRVAIDTRGNLYIANLWSIRKVDATSGIISTVVGGGNDSRGGGAATHGTLNVPIGMAFDADGNLYFTEQDSHRVRRVDAGSGIISTVAGNGSDYFIDALSNGDGGAATAAVLSYPRSVAFDAKGNLYIADSVHNGIRKVDSASGIISTIAPQLVRPLTVVVGASGSLYVLDGDSVVQKVAAGSDTFTAVAGKKTQATFSGDGGPATFAVVYSPKGLAFDAAGNLYIADQDDGVVRKVAADTGIISTVAGGATAERDIFHGDGGPATAALLMNPSGVAVDAAGNLYIADTGFNRVRKVATGSGIISTFAGSWRYLLSGDGGPATDAVLSFPIALAFDAEGNLFIAEPNRIRKVSAANGVISTVAGDPNSVKYDGGDGGPATAALIYALGIAVDGSGNLYIADAQTNRIRKVTLSSGIISSVTGSSEPVEVLGDGGPATAAALNEPGDVVVDPAGNIYIADSGNQRIRKVAAGSGIISTVAGNGTKGVNGDGGAATAASLDGPGGIAVDASGNLYISDSSNSRVRAVFACVALKSPALIQPAGNSSGEQTSPKLAWSVKAAFHNDVYLDTVNPPQKIVASDVTANAYSPANLEPLTTYYWKVVAKGDPFCTPLSTASSEVRSFTTAGTCAAPESFAGNATVTGTTANISWQASTRAASYDLYLGAAIPPRLYAKGLTDTGRVITGLASGTKYYWSVVAHAACDNARLFETASQTFSTAGSCGSPAAFVLAAPIDGDRTVGTAAVLSWSSSAGAGSYDLYLGSGSSPPLYMSDLAQTGVTVPRLSAGAQYSWRVVAKSACNPARSASSPVQRFTIATCGTPVAPAAVAGPQAAVAAGATYIITWSEAAGMDDAATYLVERASDPAFTAIVDRQRTLSTAASFVSRNPGTYYHRVFAVAGCDASRRSPSSATVAVAAGPGPPVVLFSMLPKAVMTKSGTKLEDEKTSFALENIGREPVQVLVGPQLIGSPPFFTIVDPAGSNASFLTLEPHQPKTLDIHFSGPPNDRVAGFQGSIYAISTGKPLAFTPQAYVTLKIGNDTNGGTPTLLLNGVASDSVSFLPLTGDDSGRPVLNLDLLNGGTSPMEVAAEVGPEAWLKLEKDWNTLALPAGGFRVLRLATQRTKAVDGSALPRYTYLTVRNMAGQSSRVLVEDAGGISNGGGRTEALGAGEVSMIVPFVSIGARVILTNSGGDAAPVDLIYTAEGSDGFDASGVIRASIVIPPNDVVSLTDPLTELFGAATGATGSFEIRSAKLAQLVMRAELRAAAAGGGSFGSAMPVVMRGEGARIGSSHRVAGIISTGDTKTSLILTETSGREKTTAHVALYDNSGLKRDELTIDLGRYGTKRIDDIGLALAGGASLTAARVDIDVTSGGGAVIALAIATDRTSVAGAAIVGRATAPEVHLSSLGRPIHVEATTAANTQTFTIPGAITNSTLKTTVGVSALASAVNASVALRDSATGQTTKQTISVAAGQTSEVDIPAGSGTVIVTTDAPASLYARVRGTNIADALPVVSTFSEGLTGGGSAMPLYADGLEHSIDATRGRKSSLILTELAGKSATVNVRLYEPGSRTAAVAEKDFTISANSELRLDNLFVSMGLESGPDDLDQRRKNQINVAAVVTATSGTGVIAAQALMTDNKTGDRRTIVLLPVGGVPATAIQRGMQTGQTTRRRAVGH
jgi:sugar lactone lactonase YvrE